MSTTNTRDILATNLKRQMAHDLPAGSKLSVRGWALSKGLDVKLVERIMKNHNAITLDKLQMIADALRLPAVALAAGDFRAWHCA